MPNRKIPWLMLLLVLLTLISRVSSDAIMDMLSPFIDLEEISAQAAEELPQSGGGTKASDLTYPLASVEMDALLQLHRDCRTRESTAMRTWCVGNETLDATFGDSELCPRGELTHPCTGRVLRANSSSSVDTEFLWPWEGVRCDPFTDPTTVTHIYLPNQVLMCELAKLDLSVMVSLEQLDLSGNAFYGDFPEWLGEMTMLRLLNLERNELTGDIPVSFADNDALELINLSDNQLTASTLGFFDAFRRLEHLNLSLNRIELKPPRSLFSSEFLRTMNLSRNKFYGELPDMPIFKFIESLDLSSNSLEGDIPPDISLWGREEPHDPDEDSVLTVVDVSKNHFSGDLPAVSNQTSLQRFGVHGNSFSGVLSAPPLELQTLKLAHRRLCPVGYSGSTSDVLKCEPCPRGTFSSEDGLEPCKSCPPGSDAMPGATACVECSWFTYACEGFWEDVVAAFCIGATLLRVTFLKLRRLCAGDQAQQQQDESVALMTAVRAHGRTFDGAQYAPMGLVSADTMFGGQPCETIRLTSSFPVGSETEK